MSKALAFVFLALMLAPSIADAWPARVVAVIDGDTITVEPAAGGDRVRVRLHGIDAPEARQPYGGAAKDFVIALVLFQTVEIAEMPQRRDRYGRTIAVVRVEGKVLQAELIKAGLAWVWPKYCRDCDDWQALQDAARAAGLGLWMDINPVPPWKWRRKPQ